MTIVRSVTGLVVRATRQPYQKNAGADVHSAARSRVSEGHEPREVRDNAVGNKTSSRRGPREEDRHGVEEVP